MGKKWISEEEEGGSRRTISQWRVEVIMGGLFWIPCGEP